MVKEKIHISLVVIGHVDAGMFTLSLVFCDHWFLVKESFFELAFFVICGDFRLRCEVSVWQERFFLANECASFDMSGVTHNNYFFSRSLVIECF
jgi:hypothetical protein